MKLEIEVGSAYKVFQKISKVLLKSPVCLLMIGLCSLIRRASKIGNSTFHALLRSYIVSMLLCSNSLPFPLGQFTGENIHNLKSSANAVHEHPMSAVI